MDSVTEHYKWQVREIRDQVWVLGWRAGLRKLGVSEDHPDFVNPPEFPRSVVVNAPAPGSPDSSAIDLVQPGLEALPEVQGPSIGELTPTGQEAPPEIETILIGSGGTETASESF